MTQTNSKPRVKQDTLGNEGLKFLYGQFESKEVTLQDFRITCLQLIEQSAGKRSTKDKFIQLINTAKSKQDMVVKVNNYMLAGQGLGV